MTDAMAAMGLGEGHHYIGQMKVLVKGKRAQLVDANTLAGSIVTMDACVRHFIEEAGGCAGSQGKGGWSKNVLCPY